MDSENKFDLFPSKSWMECNFWWDFFKGWIYFDSPMRDCNAWREEAGEIYIFKLPLRRIFWNAHHLLADLNTPKCTHGGGFFSSIWCWHLTFNNIKDENDAHGNSDDNNNNDNDTNGGKYNEITGHDGNSLLQPLSSINSMTMVQLTTTSIIMTTMMPTIMTTTTTTTTMMMMTTHFFRLRLHLAPPICVLPLGFWLEPWSVLKSSQSPVMVTMWLL